MIRQADHEGLMPPSNDFAVPLSLRRAEEMVNRRSHEAQNAGEVADTGAAASLINEAERSESLVFSSCFQL